MDRNLWDTPATKKQKGSNNSVSSDLVRILNDTDIPADCLRVICDYYNTNPMECLLAELSDQRSDNILSKWKNHGIIKNPPSCVFKLRLHRNTYNCKIMQKYAKNFHAPLRMVLAPRTDGIHGKMIQMTPWTTWIMSNQEKFRAQMHIRDQCRIPPKFLWEFLFLKYYQQTSYEMVAPFLRDFKFCTAVSDILFPKLDIVQESSLWRLRVTNVRTLFLFTHVLKFRVDKLASQQEATNHKLYYEFVKHMIHRHVQLEKYQDVLYEYTMFLLGRTAWRHERLTNTNLMMYLLERYIKRSNHPRLKKSVNVFLQHAEISRCYMTKKTKNNRPLWLQWEGKWTGSPTEQLLINELDNPQDFFCLFLKHGLVEEAGILLRNHKDIWSVPHYMYCAKYGSVGMLREMEKRGLANALCRVWSSRYNAFFYAVCGLNVGVVKYLVHEKKCAYSLSHVFYMYFVCVLLL